MVARKLNTQELISGLHNCIRALPLHQETIKLLVKCTENNSERALHVAQEISNYQKAGSGKALDSLIYRAHLLWDNPLPLHMRQFQTHYTELRNHWPYEHHRDLLYMEKPRKESLAYLWRDCNDAVLSKMRFEKHRWADDSTVEKLDSTQRQQLLHVIFRHYFFLKSNSRLCYNGRKLPVPIVEIPMRPLGDDIADSRIRNLFKGSIATVWNLLAWENRTLSRRNEQRLSDIMASADTRAQKRLYQRACKRAYVIQGDDGDSELFARLQQLQFCPSPLLLRSI